MYNVNSNKSHYSEMTYTDNERAAVSPELTKILLIEKCQIFSETYCTY